MYWQTIAIIILAIIMAGWISYNWSDMKNDTRVGNLLFLFFIIYIALDTAQIIEFDTTSGLVVELIMVIWIVIAAYLSGR